MSILSIITITYNNLEGLQRTVASVERQSWGSWELLVVDGGSSDGTMEWLRRQEQKISSLRWLSESDNGVYDAQNKGIALARGEYCFFLNAGDSFASDDVLERMFADGPSADIVYGNEVVVDAKGHRVGYCKGVDNPTFVDIYMSCMKHQATFIRRNLFEHYGNYDVSLKIVADWEWFLRVIGYQNDVSLLYRDVDVSFFENNGLSHNAPALCANERKEVVNRYLPQRMQADYTFLVRYCHLPLIANQPIVKFILRTLNWWAKRFG